MKILLFIIITLLFIHSSTSSLLLSKAALVLLQSSLSTRPLKWTIHHDSPCHWEGVACTNTKKGVQITALRLPAAGLKGEIPLGIFSNLPFLKTLSLRRNALSGRIPEDIGFCVQLNNLYLQGNEFSGKVPEGLFGLVRLVRLNVAKNNLNGGIKGIDELVRLKILYLERNGFIGKLPKMEGLRDLEQFNVSFNRFAGRVPKRVSGFGVESFLDQEELLCGGPLKKCSNKLSAIGSAEIVGATLVVGLVAGALLYRRYLSRRLTSELLPTLDDDSYEVEKDMRNLKFFGDQRFSLEDLWRAPAEVLGRGDFGMVYKASVGGEVVVLKRLRNVSVSLKVFREKIEEIGKFEHEGITPLRAYYFSRVEKLLIFDYFPKGSLYSLLHGKGEPGKAPLTWEIRCNIALEAARGIEYIHSRGPGFCHGHITSSNILLINANKVCVFDFCLASILGSKSMKTDTNYLASGIRYDRDISQEADVYSFGVLLLELLTGRIPIPTVNEGGIINLAKLVKSLCLEFEHSNIFDIEILSDQASGEMVQLLQIAKGCTKESGDRLSMTEVIDQICSKIINSRNSRR